MACGFSAALCRGLIEAAVCASAGTRAACFPRLYAAASLKQYGAPVWVWETDEFSAALCRGLIEASSTSKSSCKEAA